jgi:hypothetical protein
MTPFDNYLEQVAQNDPVVVATGTFIVAGLFAGVLTTLIYCIAICCRSEREIRSAFFKSNNHKFNHKRELL